MKFDRSSFDVRNWQTKLALTILSAIAFEMMFPKKSAATADLSDNDNGQSSVRSSIDSDLAGFLNNVWDRIEEAGAYRNIRGKPMDSELLNIDWERLKAMDSHQLHYCLFRDSGIQKIEFADISIRDFLASYWACNHACPTSDFEKLLRKLPRLRSRVVSRSESRCRQNGEWYEVRVPEFLTEEINYDATFIWRCIAEMPDSAILNRGKWQVLMSPIYDADLSEHAKDELGIAIRCAMPMYLAWPRMNGTAAACKFLNEFPSLLGLDDSYIFVRTVAEQLMQRYHFVSGDESDCESTTEIGRARYEFLIRELCITTAEFQLFNPKRWIGWSQFIANNPGYLESPPVEGSTEPTFECTYWFDAACFAIWLGTATQTSSGKMLHFSLPASVQLNLAIQVHSDSLAVGIPEGNDYSEWCCDGNWTNSEKSAADETRLSRQLAGQGFDGQQKCFRLVLNPPQE